MLPTGSSTSPQAFFGLSETSMSMPNADFQVPPMKPLVLPEFGSQFHKPVSYKLGVDFSFTPMQDVSGFVDKQPKKIVVSKDSQRVGNSKVKDSIGELTVETIAKLGKLPLLSKGMDGGKALYEISKAGSESDQNGMSKTEAIVCKTAKVATELGLTHVGNELIVGGLPLYLETCVEVPPLALTIPVVAEELPKAYANMEHMAKIAGEKVEDGCHKLFSTHGKEDEGKE